MKKIFSVFIVFMIAFSLTGKFTQSKDSLGYKDIATEGEAKFVPEQLIIGYADGIDMEEPSKKVKEKHGLTRLEKGYNSNFEVVKTPKDKKLEDLIAAISKEKDVKYVENNFLAYALDVPNDPYLALYQWNFDDYGKTYSNGSISNFGIQAQKAWDAGAIGSGVKIAIIDTGIAYENYINPNGYVFEVAPDLANTKFDTTNSINLVTSGSHANDDYGHGTHVCGTIAQSTNNGIGCAGIAYDATILPIKVLDAGGSGTYSAITNGIIWAADHGSQVINMSLGGSSSSKTMYNAIKYAYSKGVVIVCAAGNNGKTIVSYPAAYAECIAVGATRFDGTKSYYSNFGRDLDIVAPGGDTRVDQNGDTLADGILQQTFDPANISPPDYKYIYEYYFYQGTSMATPHVAAVAALVISHNKIAHGTTLTPSQVRTAIQSTAKDLGKKGFDTTYGYGLVDAYGAVNYTP